MGKTLYDLVDEWTRQPWDGESYLQVVHGLYAQLSEKGEEGSYFGSAVISLEKTILEIDDAWGIVIENDEEARDELRKLMQREDFKEYAQMMEVDVQTEPELKVTIPNLEALV